MKIRSILIATGIFFLNKELLPIKLPNNNKQLVIFLGLHILLTCFNAGVTFVIAYLFNNTQKENSYSDAVVSSICTSLLNITVILLSQNPNIDFKSITQVLGSASTSVLYVSQALKVITNLGTITLPAL